MKINGVDVPDAMLFAEIRRLTLSLARRISHEDLSKHKPAIIEQARQLALGRLLLLQEAKRQNITPAPVEIEEDLDRLRRACGAPEAFKEHLRQIGATTETLRQTFIEARQIEEVSRRLTAEAPEITEQELMDFYQEHSREFDEPASIRLRHVFIKCNTTAEPEQFNALMKITALHDQISSGSAPFEAIAREHSECHASRELGGDLGWIHHGSLEPVLEEAAFSLQPGALSSPLQSPQGFHLLLVEERREPHSLPFAEAKEHISERLQKIASNKALDQAIKNLRETALQQHKSRTRKQPHNEE